MYAVIKTGSKQHKVSEGDVLLVEKLAGDKGTEVVFNEVLMVSDDTDRKNRQAFCGRRQSHRRSCRPDERSETDYRQNETPQGISQEDRTSPEINQHENKEDFDIGGGHHGT